MKYTKICRRITVAKINRQKIVTQKFFCAKIFDTKNVVAKINPHIYTKIFVDLFLQQHFLHQNVLQYNCLSHKYMYIYF